MTTDVASKYGLLFLLGAMVLFFSVMRPGIFFTVPNLQTILGTQTVLLILALGLTIPFTAGEFDVSVAGIMSVCYVLLGYLNALQGWPIGWVILVVLALGAVIGLVQALLIVVVGVDSIVETLGMGFLLIGMGYGIRLQTTTGISGGLVTATTTEVFGLPLSFYYAMGLAIVLWYVLSFTPIGQHLYLVGSARDVARLSGLPVRAIRIGAFVVADVISAAAAVVLAGTLGATDPSVGLGLLLPAVAGVFLGATTIKPGRFNPWGTVLAIYFLTTGIIGLQMLGYSGWIADVFYGTALVLAVTAARLAERRYAVAIGVE